VWDWAFPKQSVLSQNLLFLLEKSNKSMKKYKKQIGRFPDVQGHVPKYRELHLIRVPSLLPT